MFAVLTRNECHKMLPVIRKIFKELYKKVHMKFTGISQYKAIPDKCCIQNFDQIQAMYTYLLTPWSRVLLRKLTSSQEIPCIFGNSKVPYCIYKCPPPAPIRRHIYPDQAHPSHFLKINLNIILPSIPGSSKWFLTLRFHH